MLLKKLEGRTQNNSNPLHLVFRFRLGTSRELVGWAPGFKDFSCSY